MNEGKQDVVRLGEVEGECDFDFLMERRRLGVEVDRHKGFRHERLG